MESRDLCIKATERNFRQELDKQVGGSWEKSVASRDIAQPAYPKFQTPTLFLYRLQTNNVLKACNLTRRCRRAPPDLHQRSSRVDPTVTSETIPLCTVRLKINNRIFPRLMIEEGGILQHSPADDVQNAAKGWSSPPTRRSIQSFTAAKGLCNEAPAKNTIANQPAVATRSEHRQVSNPDAPASPHHDADISLDQRPHGRVAHKLP